MKRSKTVESESDGSESDLSDKDEPMAMGKPVTKKKK